MSNPTTAAATTGLTARRCEPRQGPGGKLDDAQVATFLRAVPGWERKGDEIAKTYPFKNYYETMAFVNAIAWVSHREDHHPDLEVGYNKCRVRYSTHSVGGLSENDFICAAKIEALMNS